jgi:hypothetical protein
VEKLLFSNLKNLYFSLCLRSIPQGKFLLRLSEHVPSTKIAISQPVRCAVKEVFEA